MEIIPPKASSNYPKSVALVGGILILGGLVGCCVSRLLAPHVQYTAVLEISIDYYRSLLIRIVEKTILDRVCSLLLSEHVHWIVGLLPIGREMNM